MFQKEELKRLLPLLWFFCGYTALFFLWAKTFFYTLPFLLGLLLAAVIQPAISFLQRRFHWNRAVSSAAAVFSILGLSILSLVFLGTLAVREITAFLLRASQGGFSEFSKPVADFLNKAGEYLQKLDLRFWEENKQAVLDLLQNSMDTVITVFKALLSFFTSLPAVVTLLIVVVFSTFFISKDMERLKTWGKSLLSEKAVRHAKNAAENTGGMGRKYALSYLFLYFITFCETYVILTILAMPYPLVTALTTAIADTLPILGPGFVFLPVALYQLLLGEYAKALGLLIGWGVVSLIRQIIEPQLVSSTVRVHPLAMLAAVYFSLVGKNFWIFLYMLGLFTLYSVLRETGVLPMLTQPANAQEAKEES